MSDELTLSLPEKEALNLTEAAIAIDNARQTGDHSALAAALEHNLQLWTAIRTLASRPDSSMPGAVVDNLCRLADFIASTTLKAGAQIGEEAINTLININFQISEGLLEGNRR